MDLLLNDLKYSSFLRLFQSLDMGGDGGSIPGRQDLVRLKKRKQVAEKNEELAAIWRHCAISQEQLRLPIVACEKGRLYNKETLLEFLLEKQESEVASHVSSLKDVKELKLTLNPAYKAENGFVGGDYVDHGNAMFICPVIGLEMNGRWRFVFFWNCGCVVSEKAVQEVKGDNCHRCGNPYHPNDVILINGSAEEMEELEAKMNERRLAAKLEKKNKKKRKMDTEETTGTATKEVEEVEVKKEKPEMEEKGESDVTETLVESDSKGKSLEGHETKDHKSHEHKSHKHKEHKHKEHKHKEHKHKEHKHKEHKHKNHKHKDYKSSKDKHEPEGLNPFSHTSNRTVAKSVQNDPNASEVYKSLFTSHKDAKNQPTAHWVTMNTGYYR
jgi:hypothetical protein